VKPHPTSSLFPPVLMLFCTEVIFLSLHGWKEKTLAKNQRGESCGFTVFTELKIMVTMCYYFSVCQNIKKMLSSSLSQWRFWSIFCLDRFCFVFLLARCEKRHALAFHCVLYMFSRVYDLLWCSLCCIVCRQLWNRSINKKKVSHNAPWWAIVPHWRWNAFGFPFFLSFIFLVFRLFFVYFMILYLVFSFAQVISSSFFLMLFLFMVCLSISGASSMCQCVLGELRADSVCPGRAESWLVVGRVNHRIVPPLLFPTQIHALPNRHMLL